LQSNCFFQNAQELGKVTWETNLTRQGLKEKNKEKKKKKEDGSQERKKEEKEEEERRNN
jgi:hypothetical protein